MTPCTTLWHIFSRVDLSIGSNQSDPFTDWSIRLCGPSGTSSLFSQSHFHLDRPFTAMNRFLKSTSSTIDTKTRIGTLFDYFSLVFFFNSSHLFGIYYLHFRTGNEQSKEEFIYLSQDRSHCEIETVETREGKEGD